MAPISRRAVVRSAGIIALGGAAGVAGQRWWPRPTSSTAAPPTATPGTATVVRANLTAREQVAGILGYAGDWVLSHLGAPGVLTWAPAPATIVRRGQRLYEVDGRATYLLYGTRPAWRDLRPGIPAGDDVRQLEENLSVLGLRGITVDKDLTPSTGAAIRQWQARLGVPRTGRLALGSVVFAPEALRVVALPNAVGSRIGSGPVIRASSARRVVTVALPTTRQGNVAVGGRVVVTLPGGRPVPGIVTDVSRVAVGADASGSSAPPTIPVTVTLDKPDAAGSLDQAPVQVAITTAERRGVLAVPVTALEAAPGGGYDLVVVDGDGRRRLPVRLGLFDESAGLIEVSGDGLATGLRIEVPQP
jgi:peptidoglycan hydrolase-like protein with peptidoglycan-binding domain